MEDAERIENWCVVVVVFGIVLEAAIALLPMATGPLPFIAEHMGTFLADSAVAAGVYGELRFGGVVGTVLKVRIAELTGKLAPRIFSIEQVTQISKALNPFAGATFGAVGYPKGTEARDFAEKIVSILQNAGWEFIPIEGGDFDSFLGVAVGVSVSLNNEGGIQEADRLAGEALVLALREAGVPTKALYPTGMPGHAKRTGLNICVGQKA